MTSLIQLITPHLDKTDAEIAETLNAMTMTRPDPTKYTWAGLILKFGVGPVASMRTALLAVPDLGPLISEVLQGGIDFSLEESQTMLTQLVPVLGQEAVANLKAIGICPISEYQDAGFEGVLTEQEVADVRAEIAATATAAAIQTWCGQVRAILANDGNGKTIQELKALIAEYE